VKLLAVLCAIVLAGCATMHIDPANLPLATPAGSLIDSDRTLPADDEDVFVGLAFSGGGMRAAAFSYGVLSEFDRIQIGPKQSPTRLIEHVDFVSGVSGGAIAAAYFGLNGRAALADFHGRFLMRDAEESFSSILNPISVARAYEGGINGAQQFPRWLDDNLFHGATFRQLDREHRPRVWINASDIYNRTPFVFSHETFNAICSDLASYPIANAVAASAAMPVIFAPVVLRTFSDRCTAPIPDWIERERSDAAAPPILKAYANALIRYRDGSMPYIKLLDGGLVDNYGLSGFTIARLSANTPYAPLTARQAAKIRRVLFLVIDGGNGPSGDWTATAEGPTAPELVTAAAETAIDSSVRSSYTAFDGTMAEWREAIVRWRCALSVEELRKYGASSGSNCRDLKFFVGLVNFDQLGRQRADELHSIPTRFKMAPETVERVIKAARDALRANPTFQAFLSYPWTHESLDTRVLRHTSAR
jgi:NTE family protein